MVSEKQIQVLLKNIMVSPEGSELLDYLKDLSLQNYNSYKTDDSSMDGIHKGYAIAIDSLIRSLELSVEEKKPHVEVTDF